MSDLIKVGPQANTKSPPLFSPNERNKDPAADKHSRREARSESER